ncbi:MAG TPA: hypothetical protein DCP90_01545 [Clostridiales bacterium]|nr:MAG: hypothetical protein A2Y22_02040 [Clostridiales bacterium GWD2_32_59]HAN09280.1 hypothetical protein [Clostridiales bacterium]
MNLELDDIDQRPEMLEFEEHDIANANFRLTDDLGQDNLSISKLTETVLRIAGRFAGKELTMEDVYAYRESKLSQMVIQREIGDE